MSVTVQPFNGEFADEIGPFVSRIQREEFGIPITLEQQPDLFDIQRAYQQRGKGNFWIASANNELIGTIALIDAGNGIGILRKMFVRKDWRGRPERVAQQLLTQLLGWAKQQNFRKIYLGTVDVLAAAQRFYEKNGFSVFPEEKLPPEIARVKMPDDNKYYAMELAA